MKQTLARLPWRSETCLCNPKFSFTCPTQQPTISNLVPKLLCKQVYIVGKVDLCPSNQTLNSTGLSPVSAIRRFSLFRTLQWSVCCVADVLLLFTSHTTSRCNWVQGRDPTTGLIQSSASNTRTHDKQAQPSHHITMEIVIYINLCYINEHITINHSMDQIYSRLYYKNFVLYKFQTHFRKQHVKRSRSNSFTLNSQL